MTRSRASAKATAVIATCWVAFFAFLIAVDWASPGTEWTLPGLALAALIPTMLCSIAPVVHAAREVGDAG